MRGALPAPVAEFFRVDLPLHELFVFAAVIINPVADRALELDDVGAVFGGHVLRIKT